MKRERGFCLYWSVFGLYLARLAAAEPGRGRLCQSRSQRKKIRIGLSF